MAKKLEEYYNQFPDWYWKYGLHDAEFLSVSELQFTSPDWNARRNCLEICLDSSGAYEQDIRKICLYNYKIKTPEINVNELKKTWWLGDTISKLPNDRYQLEISFEDTQGIQKQFIVEFETPEIERK